MTRMLKQMYKNMNTGSIKSTEFISSHPGPLYTSSKADDASLPLTPFCYFPLLLLPVVHVYYCHSPLLPSPDRLTHCRGN